MSLMPGSPPRTPRTPPYSPRTPHGLPSSAPQTPSRTPTAASIPRPPASPLRRAASQASLHASPSRRPSALPGSAPGSGAAPGPSAGTGLGLELRPGTPQKTRARDLLRKHYGLGLGPPPPLGGGKSNQDPMDFGASVAAVFAGLRGVCSSAAGWGGGQTRRRSTRGRITSS